MIPVPVPPIEMGQVIPAVGEARLVRPADGKKFRLGELRLLVEAEIIELVPLPGGYFLVIDEEGKLVGKGPNPAATRVAKAAGALFPGDYVAGTALLCSAALID